MKLKMFAMLASLLITSAANAEVTIYKTDRSTGVRSYATSYGESARWNLRCTMQTSGRELGGPGCTLEPWSGSIYPRTGIRKPASKGLRIEVHGNKVEIDFLKKVRPGTPYSVECADEEFSGIAPSRGAREEAAFKGRTARRLLSELMEANGCNFSYYVNGTSSATSGYQQTIGLTAAVNFAKQWP